MVTAEAILVVCIVAAMTVLVGRRMWRTLGGKDKTCGVCSGSCAAHSSGCSRATTLPSDRRKRAESR